MAAVIHKTPRETGFTLIELLISIVILSIVMSITAVGYNNYTKRQVLIQEALTLKDALRNAQTQASAGEKPLNIACTRLTGYQVSFQANSYRVEAVCDPDVTTPVVATSLNNQLYFTPVPSPILFRVLNRGVDTPATITIGTISGNFTYVISVTQQGEVVDQGLQ